MGLIMPLCLLLSGAVGYQCCHWCETEFQGLEEAFRDDWEDSACTKMGP